MDELGERLGIGRTAEVYALGDERVVKLMLPDFPEEAGLREAEVSELINHAVADAPRFFGTTRVDERLGLVYQRVDGATMLDRLQVRPWAYPRLADGLALLHAEIHAANGSGLPEHRAYLRHMIARAEPVAGSEAVTDARQRLESLPDGDRLLHGDMHPGNVIQGAPGAVVIDWMTARAGPPEADVARTLHLLVGSAIPATIGGVQRWLIGSLRQAFARRYLRTYRRLRPLDNDVLRAWRLPILVARVGEEIVEELAALVAAIAAERRSSG
jgi:thiamine kinase